MKCIRFCISALNCDLGTYIKPRFNQETDGSSLNVSIDILESALAFLYNGFYFKVACSKRQTCGARTFAVSEPAVLPVSGTATREHDGLHVALLDTPRTRIFPSVNGQEHASNNSLGDTEETTEPRPQHTHSLIVTVPYSVCRLIAVTAASGDIIQTFNVLETRTVSDLSGTNNVILFEIRRTYKITVNIVTRYKRNHRLYPAQFDIFGSDYSAFIPHDRLQLSNTSNVLTGGSCARLAKRERTIFLTFTRLASINFPSWYMEM